VSARLGAACAALLCASLAPRASLADGASTVEKCVADHVAGQEARLDHHWLAARERFRACAAASCPAPLVTECTGFLRDLDERMPSLLMTVRDGEDHDVTSGELWLDGAAVPQSSWGVAIDVDPGAHELRFQREGKVVAQQTVVTAERERGRAVKLVVSATPSSSSASAAATPAPPRRTIGFVIGGVGLAAALAGGVVQITAAADYGSLQKQCAPACHLDQVGDLRTRAIVADALGFGGLAVLAAGAAIALWPRGEAKAPATAIAPLVAPQAGGVVWTGSF
jgi:hypothetical protein